MWELSPKQKDYIRNSTARYNISVGSVRSGKTICSIVAFLKFCASPIRGDFCIVGRTESSIRDNILSPMADFMGKYFSYKEGKRQLNIAGRNINIIGASDLKAENRIRGSTYAAALVDEITVIPEPVFVQLTARLSVDGARLFGATNPDSPYHWFKQNYLNRRDEPDMNLKLWNFNFDDNPSLSDEYVRSIKASMQGLWYKRFIDGLWVLAEGAIYDFFDESIHVIQNPPNLAHFYVVGIDYGTKNPCVFSLIGYNSTTFPMMWMEQEYYYDSQKAGRQKTDSEYAEDLARFIEGKNVRAIYIDPSAASFKAEMRKVGIQNILDADNDVINGIRLVGEYLSGGAFKICANCTNAISEFSNYLWDTKAALKGIERPLKEHDHVQDSIRYALASHFKNIHRRRLDQNQIDQMRNEGFGPSIPYMFQNPQQQILGY